MRDRFDMELDRMVAEAKARTGAVKPIQPPPDPIQADPNWPGLDEIKAAVRAFKAERGHYPERKSGDAGSYFADADFAELLWRDVDRRLRDKHGGGLPRLAQAVRAGDV